MCVCAYVCVCVCVCECGCVCMCGEKRIHAAFQVMYAPVIAVKYLLFQVSIHLLQLCVQLLASLQDKVITLTDSHITQVWGIKKTALQVLQWTPLHFKS